MGQPRGLSLLRCLCHRCLSSPEIKANSNKAARLQIFAPGAVIELLKAGDHIGSGVSGIHPVLKVYIEVLQLAILQQSASDRARSTA